MPLKLTLHFRIRKELHRTAIWGILGFSASSACSNPWNMGHAVGNIRRSKAVAFAKEDGGFGAVFA